MRIIGTVKRILLPAVILIAVFCLVVLTFNVSIFNTPSSYQEQFPQRPGGRQNGAAVNVIPGHGQQCNIQSKLVIFGSFKLEGQTFAQNKFEASIDRWRLVVCLVRSLVNLLKTKHNMLTLMYSTSTSVSKTEESVQTPIRYYYTIILVRRYSVAIQESLPEQI